MSLEKYHCEYFEISPNAFFQMEIENPKVIADITANVNRLDADAQNVILALLNLVHDK